MLNDLAAVGWLAGIIDGEGTVSLQRSNSKSAQRAYLVPRVYIANTDMRILRRAAEIIEPITGHYPHIHQTTNENSPAQYRTGYRVAVYSQRRIAVLLTALMPYLIGKRDQAEVVLSFCNRRSQRQKHSWYEFADKDDTAYQRCLALNQRGRSEEYATREGDR